MAKRKKHQHQEKPRMCDPGMCDNCSYIGVGNFICDKGPGEPVIVVEDWVPNENAGRCQRGHRWPKCLTTKTPFLNASGCPDPTAYHAIKNVTKAENELDTKVNFLIKVLKYIIAESGFELLARIELRDKKTGRCFR